MSRARFTDEFKRDAVGQVKEREYSVAEVSGRLEISTKSLHTWIDQFSKPEREAAEVTGQAAEIRRLKRELSRVTKERDILKKAPHTSPKMPYEVCVYFGTPAKFSDPCDVPHLQGSSQWFFYAWLKKPFTARTQEDKRQAQMIEKAWHESGKVYGYRKLHDGLREQEETC